ncbi:hypothetical protein [Pseudomonas sp. Pdm06]|uniref:hypothetical protein n=1 Tax=Pseudomonas sp. Pdm06 TaxID=1790044 RepID=UPI00177C6E4E|nr:hypothetical protein [Pseudomonas sp. Pdm06]MBD9465729.1 hypothetical protein [Pseudomonas sp. Pdm06]
MFDVTCTGNPWSDTSVAIHPEYESGFLLPQLMGALASESAAPVSNAMCQPSTSGAMLAKASAFVMRVLRLTPTR